MENYVGPGALVELVGGALGLRPAVYRDVSESPEATKLCVAVAFVAGAASAPIIGAGDDLTLPVALVIGILLTLGILLIESVIVWGLCQGVLKGQQSFGQVVRPLAAAHAPRLAYLLVPIVGFPFALAVAISVWMLAAFVVAIRAVTDRGWGMSIGLALAVGVLRWLVS